MGGRLLPLPLVGGGCFPSFSAVVGGGGGWRSSGCAVRAHNGQLRYKRFRRLSGSWAVTIPLAPCRPSGCAFFCALAVFHRNVGSYTTYHI